MAHQTRSPHYDSIPNPVSVDGQPIYGEVIDPPTPDCASPDCGRPLTRDGLGRDRFGDKDPFIEGCHAGCFIPDTSDPDWPGYIGPDTDVDAFFVAGPTVKRIAESRARMLGVLERLHAERDPDCLTWEHWAIPAFRGDRMVVEGCRAHDILISSR
jgi:hypothetical protein